MAKKLSEEQKAEKRAKAKFIEMVFGLYQVKRSKDDRSRLQVCRLNVWRLE